MDFHISRTCLEYQWSENVSIGFAVLRNVTSGEGISDRAKCFQKVEENIYPLYTR